MSLLPVGVGVSWFLNWATSGADGLQAIALAIPGLPPVPPQVAIVIASAESWTLPGTTLQLGSNGLAVAIAAAWIVLVTVALLLADLFSAAPSKKEDIVVQRSDEDFPLMGSASTYVEEVLRYHRTA